MANDTTENVPPLAVLFDEKSGDELIRFLKNHATTMDDEDKKDIRPRAGSFGGKADDRWIYLDKIRVPWQREGTRLEKVPDWAPPLVLRPDFFSRKPGVQSQLPSRSAALPESGPDLPLTPSPTAAEPAQASAPRMQKEPNEYLQTKEGCTGEDEKAGDTQAEDKIAKDKKSGGGTAKDGQAKEEEGKQEQVEKKERQKKAVT